MAHVMRSALVLSLLLLGSSAFLAAQTPADPIYIRTANGWKGVYGIDEEYAQYSVKGTEVKLQDAHHLLLNPTVGLAVAFVDRKELNAGNDLLGSHVQWELDYWKKHASKVESLPRNDLSGGRDDLRITEIRLYNNQGERLTMYLIGLAAQQGVFALGVSYPGDASVDSLVTEIASSFKLVHRKLDPDEVKRLSLEVRSKP